MLQSLRDRAVRTNNVEDLAAVGTRVRRDVVRYVLVEQPRKIERLVVP